MVIRTTPQNGSKEMYQKSNSSSSSIVGSFIKSWKAPSSSRSNNASNSYVDIPFESDRNTPIWRSSCTIPRSLSSHSVNRHNNSSPLRSNTTGGSDIGSAKKEKYFTDLDEDWSAVIDDYKMPIPTINNGGIETIIRPLLTKQPTTERVNRSSNGLNHGVYPKLPQVGQSNTTISAELRSQLELERERDIQELNAVMQRMTKFNAILKPKSSLNVIKLNDLRKLSWNGVPMDHRPQVWKLLLGYVPANLKIQQSTLHRKRQEYRDGIDRVFSDLHLRDEPTWHQIEIDIPRTNPHIPLYQFKTVQTSLQRILYLWAIRHPASGYVQGINDLVTPFYQVFLTEYLSTSQKDKVDTLDPGSYLTAEQMENVEADAFWCLTKLVEQITDYYIHGQPGILNQVKHLGQLVKRIDADLYRHFHEEGVEFIQFAVRWMNCMLMREFQMNTVIRMWDTYLSETSLESSTDSPIHQASQTFTSPPSSMSSTVTSATTTGGSGANDAERQPSLSEFHVFVCAAFLIKWSDQLMNMDFQGIITFLQNPPTKNWRESDIEMLLSEAYIWQSLYKDAISHWR
ncbi:HEL051Wp [Eremothecium sinecaudum]|uniref:HEL051Wp n=1 Tax=Eremothecium sinecaudum TaxID=45286 RepID=A0A0X8HTM0_9SACH|nr:HEL051Wp [Eremothecium sinecaudum]AMD21229.1 HEL051Wp [Eremothecium sinecaudum]